MKRRKPRPPSAERLKECLSRVESWINFYPNLDKYPMPVFPVNLQQTFDMSAAEFWFSFYRLRDLNLIEFDSEPIVFMLSKPCNTTITPEDN